MVSEHRTRFMYDAVKLVNERNITGDIVEAGVWKGGVSMLMAASQLRFSSDRQLWLYDTFEGLPAPDSEKDDPTAKALWDQIQNGNLTEAETHTHAVDEGKWNYGPLEIVQA